LCTCLSMAFEGEFLLCEIPRVLLSKLPCILLALAPLLLAAYWGIICRVEVVQVIPFYRPPENEVLKWLLVKVGGYKDLYKEVVTSEDESCRNKADS